MSGALGAALRDAAERLFDGRNYSHAPIWRQIKDLSAEQALWGPSPERFAALQRAWVGTYGAFTPQALLAPDAEGRLEPFAQVVGYLEHEAYHTGQIAYLRALMGLPSVE